MKKIILLSIFLLNLLTLISNIDMGNQMLAQNMGSEVTYYPCKYLTSQGNYQWYLSISPCDNELPEVVVIGHYNPGTTLPETCVTVCPYCGESMPCINYDYHQCVGKYNAEHSGVTPPPPPKPDPSTPIGCGGRVEGGGGTRQPTSNTNRKISGKVDELEPVVIEFLQTLKCGNGEIVITSVRRTTRDQARIMLNNILKYGLAHQLATYKEPGRKVCMVYNSKLSYTQNLANMESYINSVSDPSVFSHHLAGYEYRCTFDISQKALKYPSALFDELKKIKRETAGKIPRVDRVYKENGCIHVEYIFK